MFNLANWKDSLPTDIHLMYSDQFTKRLLLTTNRKQKEQRASYDYCFLKATQLQNITKASAKNTNHKTKCPNHKGLCQAKKKYRGNPFQQVNKELTIYFCAINRIIQLHSEHISTAEVSLKESLHHVSNHKTCHMTRNPNIL